jgi:hypothetical protein
MGNPTRFYMLWEKHIGLGIRWSSFDYQLEISISLPFLTVVLGLCKQRLLDGQESSDE